MMVVNEKSQKGLWDTAPVAARLYSGRREGVIVREGEMIRALNPARPDLEGHSGFSWGSASPSGKRLAMALLKDALEDEKRAAELADAFNARVISILPERWTMTRERILSYTDVMSREKIDQSLLGISPATPKPL